MNMKIGLLWLSFCFAGVISMSIKDSIKERSKNYQENFHKPYEPEEKPISKENSERNVENNNLNNERFKKGEFLNKEDTKSSTEMDPSDSNKMRSKHGPKEFNDPMTSPLAYDWRINETMSPVPDKADCNRGDWAFAAVGMLEGYLYKRDRDPKQLSEQDLLQCGKRRGNNVGCDGGKVKNAFDYIRKYGISTNDSYPFNFKNNECDETISRNKMLQNCEIETTPIYPREEAKMQHYISHICPLTATISCRGDFLKYINGIFTNCTTTNDDAEDYNVLIIGYGETESQKYWIVKNWMGENWGEKGYARVARNESAYKIFSKILAIENVTHA